eukprot:1456734-Pleurochrysis_carterae.AAC.1
MQCLCKHFDLRALRHAANCRRAQIAACRCALQEQRRGKAAYREHCDRGRRATRAAARRSPAQSRAGAAALLPALRSAAAAVCKYPDRPRTTNAAHAVISIFI